MDMMNMMSQMGMPGGAGGSSGPGRSSEWVTVHPEDTGVPSIYLSNPELFVPDTNEQDGGWGIPGDSGGMMAMMQKMTRQMSTQSLYGGYATDKDKYSHTPEEQWIRCLIARKEKQLNEIKKQVDPAILNSDYILEIELEHIRPRVWRRFRVSGATTLLAFQDKVLSPLLGWVRNYHAWLLVDLSDMTQYGPGEECRAIDMMHMQHNGFLALNSAKFTLGQALHASGDSGLTYHYDLGDHWMHEIKIIERISPENSNGKCIVIDGAMRCPPEDSNGCAAMGNGTYMDALQHKKGSAAWRQFIQGASGSLNCKNGATFDPYEFDVAQCQRDLEAAFDSPLSANTGSKTFVHPIGVGGFPHNADGKTGVPGFPVAKRGQTAVQTPVGTGSYMSEVVNVGKGPKSQSMCASCGSPAGVQKVCAGCKTVRYCDRNCQRKHWKKIHGKECNKRNEERVQHEMSGTDGGRKTAV